MALSSSDSDLSSDWAVISKCEESLTHLGGDSNHNLPQENSTKEHVNEGSKVEDIVQEQELPVLNDSSSSDIDIIEENFDDNPPGFVQPPPVLSLSTSVASSTIEVPESGVMANLENVAASSESSITTGSESHIATTTESSLATTSESSLSTTSESSIAATSESIATEVSEQNAAENSEQTSADSTSANTAATDQPPASDTNAPNWILSQILNYWQPNQQDIKAMKVFGMLLVAFVLHFCLTGNMPLVRKEKENARIMGQMKELLQELQFEHRDLKNQVISEIQNEKLFSIFASQVKELKNENLKLTQTLQDVILELQKQSSSHEKEMERKQIESQGLYKNEINVLKEQINILKFDNEELQKQLVRMRYGSYASEMQNDKNEETDENGTKEDTETPGISTDEVKELKRDLQEEVAKLKKWNSLVELLVYNLHHSSNRESNKKFSEEKKSHKEQNWSWKGFKRSLKGTIDEFPDMFAKYMSYNRKRIEGAFKSVRHYFKAAQEETQKVLDSDRLDFTKDNVIRKDIWKALETLGEKWSELGDKWSDFFKVNGVNKKPSREENFDAPEFSSSYFESSDKNKKENMKFGKYKHHENIIPSEMPTFSQGEYHSKQHDQFAKNGKPPNWYFKKTNEKVFKNDDGAESNSWMFERAAYRAEVRQNYEDSPINWYLRKKKENDDDEIISFTDQAIMEDGKTEDLQHENRMKQTYGGRKDKL